jgi:hypothetical protein
LLNFFQNNNQRSQKSFKVKNRNTPPSEDARVLRFKNYFFYPVVFLSFFQQQKVGEFPSLRISGGYCNEPHNKEN